MIEKIRELCQWMDETISVAGNPGVSWEVRHQLVFGAYRKHIAPLAKELNLDLDWYNPDTTYQEDIMSYIHCIGELRTQLGSIVEF